MHHKYGRVSKKITAANFENSLKIELILASKAIYEAEIQYKATGNWSENINHFGDNTQVQEMKIEVGTYLNNCSALPVMMPGILCNP